MKHLLSSLGLALLLLAWGGSAVKADAQVTYTKVQEVNFDNDQADYIPTGWTVVHNGETRASASPQGSGSRLFAFANSTQSFTNTLYLGVSWSEDDSKIKESYALYGDLDGYALTLPAGNVELRIPAFLWKSGGSTNLTVKLTKKADTDFASPILDTKEGLTYNVNGNRSDALTDIQTFKFQLNIAEADAGDYLLKVGPERVGNSELMFGGFSVYTYEGTPSKYDDESMVFEETFASTGDNLAPVEGSGWVLRDVVSTTTTDESGNKITTTTDRTKTPGQGYSGNGNRIFKLSCSDKLTSAYYCNGTTSTATYGEGINGEDEKLYLEAGEYFVSYYATAWKTNWDKSMPSEIFKILDADGKAVVDHKKQTTVNCNGSKTNAIIADHVQFKATIATSGYYTLQLSSDGETFVGSISIRKNTNLTAISEKFTGLSSAAPVAGSGWTLYKDNEGSYAAWDNGSTGIGNARLMGVSGNADITNSAYLRFHGALTYGEKEDQPLTLVGGKEYRITYYGFVQTASNNSETEQLQCLVYGKDAEQNLGTALSRTDVLSCQSSNFKIEGTPDYIETTFIPKKSGEYILKFTGYQVHVANITLAENYEDPIAYSLKLDDNFGYGTLYVDRAVAVPEGVEVYAGVLDEGKLKLNAVETNIPANTAVIVKGDKGAAVTFKLATAPAAAVEENSLVGVTVGTKLPSDAVYTLAYTDAADETTLGFYQSAAAALRANKVYLTLPAETAAEVASVRFDFGQTDEMGNVTAIDAVAQEAAPVRAIFDLQGRRVLDMSKPGLYVVGGRKVLVK
jgi:hypothetical protein